MTMKIKTKVVTVGYDSVKDTIITYFPDSHDEAILKSTAEEFSRECYKHLNKRDRKVFDSFMKWAGYRFPVQVVITPSGNLRGGNIRIVSLDEEKKKYQILDEMRGICVDHDIEPLDFRKLYGRKSLEEVVGIRRAFGESLRKSVKSLYKDSLIGIADIGIQASDKGIVAVPIDRHVRDVATEDEIPSINSKYKRLLRLISSEESSL